MHFFFVTLEKNFENFGEILSTSIFLIRILKYRKNTDWQRKIKFVIDNYVPTKYNIFVPTKMISIERWYFMNERMKSILSRVLSLEIRNQEKWEKEDIARFGECQIDRQSIIKDIREYMEQNDIKFSYDWYMSI